MLFNKPRALEHMRRLGLDVLVATSPVNITYFTDFHMWSDYLFKDYMMSPGAPAHPAQAYAVFPLEGEPALVVGPLTAVNAMDLWVRDLYPFGDTGLDDSLAHGPLPADGRRIYDVLHRPRPNATPTDALLSILNARGLLGAQIGLEMGGLTPKARVALDGALPHASVKDCSNLIRLIRAVKSPEEIRRMAYAAQISEQVGMECLAMARPGRRATDLVQHYRARIAALGADFEHFAYGIQGMGIATEADYRFAADDVLFVDFGCIYQHYFSDTGTTLAVGAIPPALRERHAALRACMAAGMQAARPGVSVSAVRGAMWQTLNGHGITASFPHGHGLGLEIRDYPIVVANTGLRLRDECVDVPSDLPLEVDMVFNLEAAVFMPGVGSPHIERSFVVTTDGCRPLTEQDRSGPFQPGAGTVNG